MHYIGRKGDRTLDPLQNTLVFKTNALNTRPSVQKIWESGLAPETAGHEPGMILVSTPPFT